MAQPQIVIDQIVALAASGLSRSVIADRIGLSRSLVIGILWRRGEKPVARLVETKPRGPVRAKAVKPGVEAVLAATNVTPIRLRDLPVIGLRLHLGQPRRRHAVLLAGRQ
jgi:hypothetical protein